MRAEKAIKEGSDLLSVPENEATNQSENIFLPINSIYEEDGTLMTVAVEA